MATMERQISVSELRRRIRQVLEDCSEKGQKFEILSNSKVAGVLVGPTEWRMLNETIEILTDRDVMRQIRGSEKQIRRGVDRPAEETFEEIERELGDD